MKVVKDELLDNRMEESGIFLIWAGRPIMIWNEEFWKCSAQYPPRSWSRLSSAFAMLPF